MRPVPRLARGSELLLPRLALILVGSRLAPEPLSLARGLLPSSHPGPAGVLLLVVVVLLTLLAQSLSSLLELVQRSPVLVPQHSVYYKQD